MPIQWKSVSLGLEGVLGTGDSMKSPATEYLLRRSYRGKVALTHNFYRNTLLFFHQAQGGCVLKPYFFGQLIRI